MAFGEVRTFDELMRPPPQSIPRGVLKREARSFLIFVIVYGIGAAVHYKFDSPTNREVVRQVTYAAGLAVVCYLLGVLFRFRSIKATAKEPNSERSDSPEREAGRRLNKPGFE